MKKTKLYIYFIVLISAGISAFTYQLPELDIKPELYREALIKQKSRRVEVYRAFSNYSKALEQLNILKEIDEENINHYKYLEKEIKMQNLFSKEENGSEVIQNNHTKNNNIVIYSKERMRKLIEMANIEKDPVKRIELYKSVLVHEPENKECQIGIGKSYIEINKFFEARKWFVDAGNEEFLQRIDYIKNSRVHLMKVDLKKSVEKKSVDNKTLDNKINKFIQNKEFESAINLLKTKINEDPANFNHTFRMAEIYISQNKISEAMTYLDLTLLLNPRHANALYKKGDIHKRMGQYNQALKIFHQIQNILPEDSEYYGLAENQIQYLSTE
ncbi:MAG: tetratricopeptide repeat protein [Candidatus Muiribacteriota bacterium]